jgi:cell division septum initiation protein DivIVA
MEVHDKLGEVVTLVDSARTMPMSSTAMVNKQQLLAMLDEIREGLPGNLRAAEAVLGQREALLMEARGNADRIVANARAEQAKLVADHTVTQAARSEAEEILRVAREHADAIRADADDYVDAKLARLEVAAQRIVETVRDGREQLRHPTSYDEIAHRSNGQGTATSTESKAEDREADSEEPPTKQRE